MVVALQVSITLPFKLDLICAWSTSFKKEEHSLSEVRAFFPQLFPTKLAIDAAHVHSPTGGQGMNVSVQDAVNHLCSLTKR